MKQTSRSRTLARYSQLFPGQLRSTGSRQHCDGFWVEQCQTTDFETPTVAYTNHLIAIHLDPEFTARSIHEVVNSDRLQILPQLPLHDQLIWEVGSRLAQGIDPQSQYGHL